MRKIRNHLGRDLKSKRTRDKLSPKERSLLMSKIRSKGTRLELKFFKGLRKQGIDFQIHPKDIIGHPDLIVRRKKICVFIDSDFWHGWQYPRWKHKLKNRFWRNKIENNRKRDRRITNSLKARGWKVIRVWEHELALTKFKNISI